MNKIKMSLKSKRALQLNQPGHSDFPASSITQQEIPRDLRRVAPSKYRRWSATCLKTKKSIESPTRRTMQKNRTRRIFRISGLPRPTCLIYTIGLPRLTKTGSQFKAIALSTFLQSCTIFSDMSLTGWVSSIKIQWSIACQRPRRFLSM